jgi:predicted RNA-binding Zn ribbon-like protein
METHDIQFVFVGNNAAIDLINTEIVSRGELLDLLQDDADLIRWAREASFDISSRLTAGDLSAAKQLRAALKELCQERIDQHPAGRISLVVVNQHLQNHATHEVLQANTDTGDYELAPDKAASSVTALLANLAYEGAVLLASPQATQLKRCGNPECVLIFLDTSRNQKRRWCSMDTCGNRAKVAKHYRKQTQ